MIMVREIDGYDPFCNVPNPSPKCLKETLSPIPKPTLPQRSVIPIVQPDSNARYYRVIINGYSYLVRTVFGDVQDIMNILNGAGFIVSISPTVVEGTDLRPIDKPIPIGSTSDLFQVTAFFYHNNYIIRYSKALEDAIARNNFNPVGAQPDPSATVKMPKLKQKLKMNQQGDWIATTSKKLAMYLSWVEDGFNVSKEKQNDSDV
jgi:hypothetical protein